MQKTMITIIALLLLTSSMTAQKIKKDPERIKLFVTGDSVDGFMESGIADSVVDLKKALSTKTFVQVDDVFSAQMIITISGRMAGSEIVGNQTRINRGIFGGLYASNTPIVSTWFYLGGRIHVGEFQQEVLGYGKFWRAAASGFAGYADRWAKSNRGRIVK
jgi:hypothetical protein